MSGNQRVPLKAGLRFRDHCWDAVIEIQEGIPKEVEQGDVFLGHLVRKVMRAGLSEDSELMTHFRQSLWECPLLGKVDKFGVEVSPLGVSVVADRLDESPNGYGIGIRACPPNPHCLFESGPDAGWERLHILAKRIEDALTVREADVIADRGSKDCRFAAALA